MGVPEEEAKRKVIRRYLRLLKTENFPNTGKEIATQAQEAQRVPYGINSRRNNQDTY